MAWSFYIENHDAEALALARSVAHGAGPWVAEGWWTAGLAAWRLNQCAEATDAFERAGVEFRSVSGHLEDERAWARIERWVKAAGVRAPMEVRSMGEREPVTRDCQGLQRSPRLVACLQPDRRVVVDILGQAQGK